MDKISDGEARNLVRRIAKSSDNVNAYISGEMITERCVESGDGSARTSPYKKFWFGFVDDAPDARWPHKCRYVFIDAYGRHSVRQETFVPVWLEEGSLEQLL